MPIFPPHMHMHVSVSLKHGPAVDIMFGFDEIQGATIAGTHGIGVSTPSAAAVAAATVGFERVEHIPNDAMFNIGTKSMIVATGIPQIRTGTFGRTTSGHGAIPNEH
jgi:hypothetical protein